MDYRLRILRRDGLIPGIIEKDGLEVEYDVGASHGSPVLWADWRKHRERFPAVAIAMEGFLAGKRIPWRDLYIVRGVLAAALRWRGIEMKVMFSKRHGRQYAERKLREMWEALEGYKVRRLES